MRDRRAAAAPCARRNLSKIRLRGASFAKNRASACGLDYRGAGGEPVSAAEAGTVVAADRFNEETKGEAGYGNYVRIDHGNGLQTAYAHLLNFNVKAGQCVSKGEVIGNLGNSGVSTEPHLHFEVIQNGRFADPSPLLPGRS